MSMQVLQKRWELTLDTLLILSTCKKYHKTSQSFYAVIIVYYGCYLRDTMVKKNP